MIQHLNPSATAPARVVLLGGSGFLGKYLNPLLVAEGIATLSLSSRDIDLTSSGAVAKLASMLQPSDAVVFASCLTPDKGKDIATTMKNLAMGQNVAAALEKSPCQHLVYISSDAVYADHVSLIRESTSAEPRELYGMGHLMRERMMEFAAKNADVPLLIVRSSVLYGVGDTHNSYGPNRFRRTAEADGTIELFGGGEERRDHVYVEDAAALVGLGLKHKSQGVLNMATGTSPSFHEVATLLTEQLARPIEIVCHPRRMPITHRHFDVTATLKAFPSFRFTPIVEGLAKACRTTGELEGSLAAA